MEQPENNKEFNLEEMELEAEAPITVDRNVKKNSASACLIAMLAGIAGILVIASLLLYISFRNINQMKGTDGNGNIVKLQRNLPAFNSIDASGAYNIDITCGGPRNFEITTDDNIANLIVTQVEDGRLKIYNTQHYTTKNSIQIKISAENIDELNISGATKITMKNVAGKKLSVTSSGAGDIDLQGRVNDFAVKILGAGNLQAQNLLCENVLIKMSGAGNGTIYATDSVNAEISGVGKLEVYGRPQKIKKSVSGMATFEEK